MDSGSGVGCSGVEPGRIPGRFSCSLEEAVCERLCDCDKVICMKDLKFRSESVISS
jgi:hypothetical protein